MSSELSAWTECPWQNPSCSLFCCNISPLRLQDCQNRAVGTRRTEPPPTYTHTQSHTHSHSHTLRHRRGFVLTIACVGRKEESPERPLMPDQGQMPAKMVLSQQINIVLSSHVCCPTWALPPKNFALIAPLCGTLPSAHFLESTSHCRGLS